MDKEVIKELLFHMMKLESVEELKFSIRIALDKINSVILSKTSDYQKQKRIKAIVKEIDGLNMDKDIDQQLSLLNLIKPEVTLVKTDYLGINIAGFSVSEYIQNNKDNTAKRLLSNAYSNIFSDEKIDLEYDRKVRQVQTITTTQSILTAVRGFGRSIQGKNKECDRWINIGVGDARQTKICRRAKGAIYEMPYRYIVNKPPRRPPVHRCRSFLLPSCKNNKSYVPPKDIKELLDRNIVVKDYLKSKGNDNPETFKELQGNLLLSENTIKSLVP